MPADNLDAKKVKLNLVDLDGNIFSIGGAFMRAARKQGWSRDDIDAVMSRVHASESYDEALNIFIQNTESE